MPYSNWYALATLLAEDYSKVIGVTTDLRDIRDFLDHIRICFIVLTGASVAAICIYIVGMLCGVTRGGSDGRGGHGHHHSRGAVENYLDSRQSSARRALHSRYAQRAPSYSSAADDVEMASRTHSPTLPATTPTTPVLSMEAAVAAAAAEKRKASFPLDRHAMQQQQMQMQMQQQQQQSPQQQQQSMHHHHPKIQARLSTVDENDDMDSNNESDESKHDAADSLLRTSSHSPSRASPYGRASIPGSERESFPPPPSQAEIETSQESRTTVDAYYS